MYCHGKLFKTLLSFEEKEFQGDISRKLVLNSNNSNTSKLYVLVCIYVCMYGRVDHFIFPDSSLHLCSRIESQHLFI